MNNKTKIHKWTNQIRYMEDNLELGTLKTLKMIDDHSDKMRYTIEFLSSMLDVKSGHTEQTKQIIKEALEN